MCCMYTVYSGMQEWVIQIPSIPILVSVLFPSLHLKYFRIKFLLLVIIIKQKLNIADIGMQKKDKNKLCMVLWFYYSYIIMCTKSSM